MNGLDYGLIPGIMRYLRPCLEEKVGLYHYVPEKVELPYVSLELGEVGEGNGLPPPHFQTKVEFQIHVWSAYAGLLELHQIMKKMAEILDNHVCELEAHQALLKLVRVRIEGQQESQRQKVRKGILDLEARIF
jgi:hypothetical protein